MKNFQLILVIENINRIKKVKKISNTVSSILDTKDYSISEYYKIANSYKVEYKGKFKTDSDSIEESIKLTNKLCSPWTVFLNEAENEIELIFNKTSESIYKSIEFNTIKWSSFQVL